MGDTHGQLAIVAVAKDEFLGLLDWVAWHLSQGFAHVVVVDNESTDGTKEVLEALEELQVVRCREIAGSEGGIQEAAYAIAVGELTGLVDFAAFVDVDEYFVSHDAVRVVDHLQRALMDEQVSVVLTNWRVFGTGGRRFSGADPVILTHFDCAPWRDRWQHQVKSVVRLKHLDRMRVHVPQLRDPSGLRVHTDGTPYVAASSGASRLVDGFSARYVSAPVTLHHYVVQSEDDLRLHKDPRGSAATRVSNPELRARIKSQAHYLEKYDRNEDVCYSAKAWERAFGLFRADLIQRLVSETNLCRGVRMDVTSDDGVLAVELMGLRSGGSVVIDVYLNSRYVSSLHGKSDLHGRVRLAMKTASNLSGSERWRFRLRGSLSGSVVHTLEERGAGPMNEPEGERDRRIEAYRLMMIERDKRLALEGRVEVLQAQLSETRDSNDELREAIARAEVVLTEREETLRSIFGSRRWRYWSRMDSMRGLSSRKK